MTTSLPQFAPSLIEQLIKHQVVPFVGSGVSLGVKAGFPTWPGLIEMLAARLAIARRLDEAGLYRDAGVISDDE